MNFSDALVALKAGSKIRRKSYEAGKYFAAGYLTLPDIEHPDFPNYPKYVNF